MADSVAAAQLFVATVFPELKGRRHVASVSLSDDFDNDWRLSPLVSISIYAHDAARAEHSRVVLGGGLQILRGRVMEASFQGEHVKSDLLKEVAANVKAIPAATEADTVAALKSAGAAYTPEAHDAFVRAADLQRFTQALGTIVKFKARFIARPPMPLPDPPFEPVWLVNVETEPAPGVRACYDLMFEPFGARLIRLTNWPCR